MGENQERGTDIEAQRLREISTEENHGITKLEGFVAVPIEELENFMKKRLSELPGKPFQPRSVTIFRLPGWIHEKNKELCEPKIVSIGPYHHGKEKLRTMEEHKWYTLRKFLARNKNISLEFYLQAMRSIEAQVRDCYSDTVDRGSDDFVMMLLLDGCFILEWLLRYDLFEKDAFCEVGWAVGELLSDMCLLENQIPFFVIHKLLAIKDQDVGWSPNCKDHCRLLTLISDVLRDEFYLTQFRSCQKSCDDIDHLLHLCYTGAVPDSQLETQSLKGNSDTDKSKNLCGLGSLPWSKLYSKSAKVRSESSEPANVVSMYTKQMNIPCISELHDAGVIFKRKQNPTSMLDISFNKGTIEMPFLHMEPPKIRILWNMVAFEQSGVNNINVAQILSSYLALMDSLINTEKDVVILERSGILDNFFQNAGEAAIFFNQFDKIFPLNYDSHYFYDLFKDIKQYSKSKWRRYRVRLMKDYFSTPWSIISVVAAGILLVLTVLQTYYSAAG